jgi:hypothetical protein
MIERSRDTRGLVLIVALLVAAVGACDRGGTPGAQRFAAGTEIDTVEAEVERDTEPPAALNINRSEDVVIARAKTPTLPNRIDSLSDAQLVQYLNSLHWKTSWSHFSTQRAKAPCVHRTSGIPCASGDSADLLIQPEAGMSKWEHDDIPPNGIIVARIINKASGDRDADSLGFRAGAKTWWVVDDSAGTLRSRFFVRTYSKTKPIAFVTKTRPFVRCSHPDAPNGRAARGKFWNCTESAADSLLAAAPPDRGPLSNAADSRFHLASYVSSVPVPPSPRPLAMLTSAWVTCAAGCCSTGP